MIGFLKGKVVSKSAETFSVVICGESTGYEVTTTRPAFEMLSDGQDATFWVYTHVREDNLQLFGFPAELEKKVFKILLSASGVGPKVAMSLLGELGVKNIVEAIHRKDSDALSEAPGVGKKLAQKMVLELGSKIEKLEWLQTAATLSQAVRVPAAEPLSPEISLRGELSSALQNLSFPPNSVRSAIDRVFSASLGPLNFETAFKHCLQELSGRVQRRDAAANEGGLNG